MNELMDQMIPASAQEQIILIVLAAIISFGSTEISKPFLKSAFKDRDKSNAIVRLLAVFSGALVGYTLGDSWNDIWVGSGAGVLNAWAIAIIKKKLEDKFEVKLKAQRMESSSKKFSEHHPHSSSLAELLAEDSVAEDSLAGEDSTPASGGSK